jgi:hypothetical protein
LAKPSTQKKTNVLNRKNLFLSGLRPDPCGADATYHVNLSCPFCIFFLRHNACVIFTAHD